MKSVAFITTIYPISKGYLMDFFSSLDNQEYKEFDVIVVNDGYEGLEEVKIAFDKLNLIELSSAHVPVKNREIAINYAVEKDYKYIVFGDCDDYFDNKRVQVSVDLLNEFDVVVNDLTLVNDDGVLKENYISNRFSDLQKIYPEDIREKNIFGLSNSAVKVRAIGKVSFDSGLIALDWHIFSVMLLNKCTAVFTNKTATFYRQHDNNLVGIGSCSNAGVKRVINVKVTHYEMLQEYGVVYQELYNRMLTIQDISAKEKDFEKYCNQDLINRLWWEEVT